MFDSGANLVNLHVQDYFYTALVGSSGGFVSELLVEATWSTLLDLRCP